MTSPAEILEFTVPQEMDGVRLDKVLADAYDGLSRSYLQKLFERDCIRVNEAVCQEKKYRAAAGDAVVIEVPQPQRLNIEGEDIPLDIVYEDASVIVVNKPAGMVVHPAPGSPSGTLVNALVYRYGDQLSSINGVIRPGIVHRIDKDTSGLLMVARNDRAHEALSRQLADHSITRRYTAIVRDNVKEDAGTIEGNIGRDPRNRLRNAVVAEGGKPAVTHYRVLERFGRFTLVEAILETGRTHQIRVHMSHIRHPLLGDALYGPASADGLGAQRQMLHAGVLGFVHPDTGDYMEFTCQLPQDFADVLTKLRRRMR